MNTSNGQGIVENLIFDVGAHRGEDSAYYLSRGFRVVAVECAPEQLAILRTRFEQEIADGRLTLIERAISREAGPVTFYQNNSKSAWGTAQATWADRNRALGTEVEEITVQGIKAEDLFAEFGIPFYLKIDVEGRDLLVASALEHFSSRPPYLSIAAEARSMNALKDEFRVLSELGYDRFKVSAQQHISRQRVPGFSLQGRPVQWEFEPGSSGLFGEDLLGPWLTEARALEVYAPIMLIQDLERAIQRGILSGSLRDFLREFEYELGWYDTHARHGSWPGRPPRARFARSEPALPDDSPGNGTASEDDQRLSRLMEALSGCGGLKYVQRRCCNSEPGVDEAPEWQVWTELDTTVDQKRIEEQLEQLVFPGARLLHIGAGNSSLGARFAPRAGLILGTTIHEEECVLAASLGLPNYSVIKANKYSEEMDGLAGPFDFIIDNNPASFACCLYHFARMLNSYKELLNSGGLILMADPGMRWVVTGNDPNWSLSEKDWAHIGDILQMPLEQLDANVFAMRAPNR